LEGLDGALPHSKEVFVTEFWTDERTELAVKLRREGLNNREIAGRLGEGKNLQSMVGSKLWRMGERGKGGQPVAKKKSKLPQDADTEKVCASTIGFSKWVKEEGGVPLAELKDHGCRWPFAGALEIATRFCGQKSSPGSPYCERHNRKAWQRLEAEARTSVKAA
jgi:GcrA cell cycle regulator